MMNVRSLALALALPSSMLGFAQGPLEPPPGSPAPNFKTLEEVEPRKPIAVLPFEVRESGSYYLDASLTGRVGSPGITVSADQVSIDLNGFTLQGVRGSGSGVVVRTGIAHVSIENGFIASWDGHGIDGLNGARLQVRNVQASENLLGGIALGPDSNVTGCRAFANGTGIEVGSGSAVESCLTNENTGEGIKLAASCRLLNCTSNGNRSGILAAGGCTIDRCGAAFNAEEGIDVSDDCTVRRASCHDNGSAPGAQAQIRASGTGNLLVGNHVRNGEVGLQVEGAGNRVTGNVVAGHATNYEFVPGNRLNLILSEIPETISWPAHVVLGGTLTGVAGRSGIVIESGDVTIDLGGHSLIGVTDAFHGIETVSQIPRLTNITIRNGSVRGWPQQGVSAQFGNHGLLEEVRATGNGEVGLDVGDGWIVKDCAAHENGGAGLVVSDEGTISNCVALANTGNGVQVASSCTVRDCVVRQNMEHGIRASNDNRIVNNTCDQNLMNGIILFSGDNRIEGNNVTDNSVGIGSDGNGGSLVIKNTAAGNNTNYEFGILDAHGPVIAAGSGDLAGVAGAEHPWANFSF